MSFVPPASRSGVWDVSLSWRRKAYGLCCDWMAAVWCGLAPLRREHFPLSLSDLSQVLPTYLV